MSVSTSPSGDRSVLRSARTAGDLSRDGRGRIASMPPILQYGFRPFFFLAALHAGLAIPSWLWADYVLDVKFSSIVGRSPELGTSDRVLLYGGNLLFVFIGFVLFAWATRLMYRTFNLSAPPFWDVFFFLIGSAMLAAFIGFFFPFLGLMI